MDWRRVDVLVLRSDEHCRHSHKLKVLPLDLLNTQIAVDDANSDEEGFGVQLEFVMNLNEPVHKNSPHLLVNVSLFLHVPVLGKQAGLCASDVISNLSNVLNTLFWDVLYKGVNPLDHSLIQVLFLKLSEPSESLFVVSSTLEGLLLRLHLNVYVLALRQEGFRVSNFGPAIVS